MRRILSGAARTGAEHSIVNYVILFTTAPTLLQQLSVGVWTFTARSCGPMRFQFPPTFRRIGFR